MINRLKDKSAIENLYTRNNGKSTILILYARNGVGKSYLTDNIFLKKLEASYIRVKINQQEAEDLKDLYISSIARALNKYAHETNKFHTVEDFINNIYDNNKNIDRGKVVDDLLDVLTDITKIKIIKEKLDQNKKDKKNLIAKILQNDNDILVSILIEYIIYISTEKNLIISIENIQYAGDRLISFLDYLIQKTKKLFLIGEYSISDSDEEVVSLFRKFSTQNIEFYELKKLNKQELIGAIKSNADKNIVDDVCKIIENSYDLSHGNLINLEWLLKKNNLLKGKELKLLKYDETFHSLYSNLTNEKKMALWHVVAHIGKVHLQIFNDFISSLGREEQKSIEILNSLKELDIIVIYDDALCIAHDSILELLKEEDDYLKFISIANYNWLNFYRKMTINNDFSSYSELGFYRQDALILQLTFIINIGGNTNIDWMNFILSEINASTINTSNYSLISKITKIFYQIIENNTNKNLIYKSYEWIVIILYKLGFSQEICNILKRYSPPNTSELLFLLQSSARIATCDQSVKAELETIDHKNNSFLYTGSQLLLVRYYRTFNQLKKSRNIWDNLLSINKSTPYREIILQQANISSFNIKKRLKYLKLAENGLQKIKENNYQLCSTLLNINANIFYLYFWKIISKQDFLKNASENLQKVKDILPDSHYPMHAYLNQKTIFQLVSGKISTEILMNNFCTAYINCGIPGNKPLIGSNIIALALMQNNLFGIEKYVNELMENSRVHSNLNSEFARYPLINCYNYFYKIGDKPHQNEAINLVKKGNIFNDNVDYFISPLLIKILFRNIKYYPCNIINWDIDFENMQK